MLVELGMLYFYRQALRGTLCFHNLAFTQRVRGADVSLSRVDMVRQKAHYNTETTQSSLLPQAKML
jgi:hypothetical protein